MDPSIARKQISPLIEDATAHHTIGEHGPDYYGGTDSEVHAAHTRMTAAIERWSPAGSSYRNRMEKILERDHVSYQALHLAGVLQGLLDDIEAGYLQSVEQLVHADVFSDFLEMAEELLTKNYKDPAAVLVGSVLEEHLRKLASQNGIAIETAEGRPMKADTINASLVKGTVYSKLEQKSVTAWLGLRNAAAHGEYDQYSHDQVERLLQDIRSFITRYPA